MSRLRMALTGLLITAGVGVIAAVLVLPPRQPPPYTSPSDPANETPTAAALASKPSPPPPRTAALFVGDEVAAGTGARGPDYSFAAYTARALGWNYYVDAQAGSGYVAAGENQLTSYGSYGKRINDDVQAFKADVVIVSGGENDRRLDGFVRSVRIYLAQLRAAYPAARILILKPFYDGAVAPAGLILRARQLRDATVDANLTWVDTTGWLAEGQATATGAVPDAGQQAIARRLTAVLRRIPRPVASPSTTRTAPPTSAAPPSGAPGSSGSAGSSPGPTAD